MQQFETTPNLIELMPYPQIYVERTLVIVKPDAMPKVNEIEHIILNNGFTILAVSFFTMLYQGIFLVIHIVSKQYTNIFIIFCF